jgi:methyl-accepting chemotaxis protein
MGDSVHSQAPTGRKQRQLKNLLLDRHFQLKYTGYLVAIAVVVSSALGFMLWQTSAQVIRQSERSAAHGEMILRLGTEVVEESHKVSAVVRMSIENDPIYQAQPELLEAFNADAAAQDRRLAAQEASLKHQRARLAADAKNLRSFHTTLLWSLVGFLSALVAGIGLAGIVVTHKVAGPIFKMKRHLRDVAAGNLDIPWGLRKGDELVEFFEVLREMIQALRAQRSDQVAQVDEALAALAGKVPDEDLAALRRYRDDLAATIT